MKLLPSLKQLEYLTALAETGHFAQAAARCNVTPSTLSAGIRDLETVLGTAVAERTKRSVLMTPVGRAIAERARGLLRDAEDLMALAIAERDPLAGDVALGAIPTISPFVLPKALPSVQTACPALRLYLREEQTAVLLSRLREGEIDAALIALPWDTDGLAVAPLYDDDFLFACPAAHALATRRSIDDDDLVDQPLLLLEEGHCLRGHALDACRLRRSPVRIQFEATSLQTLVHMVASGLGVTLLPRMAVDAGLAALPDIALIPLSHPASRQIGMVWRRASPRGATLERLADLFRAAGA